MRYVATSLSPAQNFPPTKWVSSLSVGGPEESVENVKNIVTSNRRLIICFAFLFSVRPDHTEIKCAVGKHAGSTALECRKFIWLLPASGAKQSYLMAQFVEENEGSKLCLVQTRPQIECRNSSARHIRGKVGERTFRVDEHRVVSNGLRSRYTDSVSVLIIRCCTQ